MNAGYDNWVLLFLSIALGMLVGLQRESINSKTAGIRTFPLITLAGTICGFFAKEFNGWIIAAGLIAVALLLVISGVQRSVNDKPGEGITTEMAVLVMFLIGAFLVFGDPAVAVVLTGTITVLLHFKSTLHGWVQKFGTSDLKAIMQFVIISMVILPVLPDKTYDPFNSINPKNVWLMVVLIVGISLSGYFLYKFIKHKEVALIGGLLGGLISSTATTLSYSKLAAKTHSTIRLAVFVIVTASAVSLIRVIFEISIVATAAFDKLILPICAELLIAAILSTILFLRQKKEKLTMPEQTNPAELKSALVFALLYAAISFVAAFTLDKFGDRGLYLVSIISGLTDLDAITLSTAKMADSDKIQPELAWRLILVAALSNLGFKTGLAFAIGGKKIGKRVALLFGILVLTGLGILFLWPS